MGFVLLIPFILIRFGLLSLLDKTAIGRAAHFPPMENRERLAYWIYQLSNVAIIIDLFFLRIEFTSRYLFLIGAVVYLIGNLLLIVSMVNFAHPSATGINRQGLYRFSRNPIYIAYFVYFIGCVLLTQSFVLLGVVLLFQVSAHWIILSEEKWCIKNFGEEYLRYMKNTRRYI